MSYAITWNVASQSKKVPSPGKGDSSEELRCFPELRGVGKGWLYKICIRKKKLFGGRESLIK